MDPMRLVRSLWLLLPLSLTLGACVREGGEKASAMAYPEPQVVSGGKLIAQVGPVAITSAEVQERINQQSPFLRARFKELDKRKEFAEQEIHFELLSQEAWRRELYKDDKMVRELKKLMVGRLIEMEMDKRLGGADVSDADLRREYEASRDEYNKPERIRLSQIVRFVSDDAARAKARSLLEKVKAEIVASEKKGVPGAFPESARKYSEHKESMALGGDLDFMDRDEVTKAYSEEIAKIIFDGAKIGDLIIVDAEDAVVLFRKTGRRREVARTLEMVKPQLLARIGRARRGEAMKSFLDELMKAQQVRLDESAIDAIQIDLRAPSKGATKMPTGPAMKLPGQLPTGAESVAPVNAAP